MRQLIFTVTAAAALLASAAIPEGYYSAMEGKSKAELKEAAKSCAKKHTVISYGDQTWDAFRYTDVREVGGALCWWDMYSNNNVKVSNGHPGMNIEHSVANSWWGGTKNDAYKDIHHLNPSDSEANNRKSNFPLGVVSHQTWTNGVTTVGQPASGSCGGAKNVYEPADQYKGDFARVFFYMFTIYDDIAWMSSSTDRNYMFDGSSYPSLRPWAYTMLLEWARQDPVDEKEIARNEAIYSIQKNRNPYIDFPELAEYVWGSKTSMPFYASEQGENPDPGPGPGPDPGPGPEPGPEPEPIEGVWEAVVSPAMLTDEDKYIIVSVKDYVAMGWTLVNDKAINRAEDVLSPAEGVISKIGPDVAIVRLEKAGAQWNIRLYNQDDEPQGYLSSTTAKTTKLSADEGSNVTINVKTDCTELDFGPSIGLFQYNASSPRFSTYTSNQQGVMLYRKRETSGVPELATPGVSGEDMVFDLMGRRVSPGNLRPGIYIRAGRKVIVK